MQNLNDKYKTRMSKPILGDPGAVSRGRAKWRDESFQKRAEEPLGTKSHRTISKRLREYRLLIGQKKIPCIILPNRRAATLESLSCVLTRRLFRPFLKTFVAPFRPPPTDCPWVSEDGRNLDEAYKVQDNRTKISTSM